MTTLAEVAEAMAARRLVALNVAAAGSGWQASARTEGGSGWLVGVGQKIEDAIHKLLAEASRSPEWVGKTRYFARTDEPGLAITYNGKPPLASEGRFEEIDAGTWAARRREADAKADYEDLL